MKLFLGQMSGVFSAHSGVMFATGRNIAAAIYLSIGILFAILGALHGD